MTPELILVIKYKHNLVYIKTLIGELITKKIMIVQQCHVIEYKCTQYSIVNAAQCYIWNS